MKKVEWPDIQEFMEDSEYADRVYFDPENNVWFVPEDMIKKHEIKKKNNETIHFKRIYKDCQT